MLPKHQKIRTPQFTVLPTSKRASVHGAAAAVHARGRYDPSIKEWRSTRKTDRQLERWGGVRGEGKGSG